MNQTFCILLSGLLGVSGLTACNRATVDDPEEDYAALFPFKGIDKPEPSPGEVIVRTGDYSVTKKTFTYLGNEAEGGDNEYTITLKYQYGERAEGGGVASRYLVRFVDERKQLVSISSNPNTEFMDAEEYEALNGKQTPQDFEMENGESQTHTFKARSGFQMLLCVVGAGPRTSYVKASITAVSTDGSVLPITLSSEEYQNSEGQVSVTPYCKYVILP